KIGKLIHLHLLLETMAVRKQREYLLNPRGQNYSRGQNCSTSVRRSLGRAGIGQATLAWKCRRRSAPQIWKPLRDAFQVGFLKVGAGWEADAGTGLRTPGRVHFSPCNLYPLLRLRRSQA